MKDLIESFRKARAHPRVGVLRVANAVKDTETITIGGVVFEASTDNVVAAGRVSINLSAAASLLAATITGTFSGVGTANDTVVVGATTYTLKGTLTGVANEVLIGGSAGATRDNLVAAINAAAGAGTTYGTGTVANASVTAAASSTADIVLTAKVKGTVGNSIAISEAGSNFSFAGAATVLAGGADTSAADFTTIFAATVNANPSIGQAAIGAARISANEVLLFETVPAASPLSLAETMAGTNNEFLNTAMYGGESAPLTIPNQCMFTRAVQANEVAVGNVHIKLPFIPNAWIIGVHTTSTGARRSWDGTVVKTGNRLTLAGGTTPLAATETITILASE